MADKVVSLNELPALIAALRQQNKSIVYSHGIFDLLHIGHIRHLQQASKLGDCLIVTVTPDKYVYKGPHRPIFAAELRVQALAELDCVVYVAINEFETGVEAIGLIRPDIYVKGSDFESGDKVNDEDFSREEKAVIALGGHVRHTDDFFFSSSNLINRYLPVFPKEVSDYLLSFASRHPVSDVVKYLNNASRLKVLVVGEAIIDEYQFCQAIGKSSKEPTLVVKKTSEESFAGGILAKANHVAGFTNNVTAISLVGDDNKYTDFIHNKLNPNIRAAFVPKCDSPTIVKRRYVESYFMTKLFEVYEINDAPLNKADDDCLCGLLEEYVPSADVVIVTDFGHTMMTKGAVDIVATKARFLALNVQSNAGNMGFHTISAYPRADYISISENEARLEARDKQRDLMEIVLELCDKLKCEAFSLTRGKNGSLCYHKNEGFVSTPALAGQVVDRIGAGDASLSVTALCVAQQAPVDVVGFLGNAAGAQAVATVGNREPISSRLLTRYVQSLLR